MGQASPQGHSNGAVGGGRESRVSAATACSVVIANMVGIGVFTSAGFQVEAVPSGFGVLLLWVTGGLVALCGALCYAELAAALPRSGGEYHFLSRIFHPLPGFLSGWISATVGFAAPIALAAMAFADYLGGALPWLPRAPLAVGLVVATAIVHSFNLRFGGAVQRMSTWLKVLLIVCLCVALFSFGGSAPAHFLPAAGDPGLIFSAPFAVSLVFVMYSYSGWNSAAYIADEVRDPGRSLPLALVGGAIVVTFLYVLINAAFLFAAPMSAMSGKVEVALIAARAVFGETGADVTAALIGIGLISTVSAMTWAGPRVSLAMGEDHRGLRFLACRNRSGIPIVALWVQTALALAMLLTASFKSILLYVEFVLSIPLMMTVFGVIWLRLREPDLPRPFRVWGYPITPLIFLGMEAWFIVALLQRQPRESIAGIATLALGALVYFLTTGRGAGRATKPSIT